MKGIVKVGKSGRDPVERAKELDSTAHPEAFCVEYDILVSNYHVAEQQVHNALSKCRIVGTGQAVEFFACTVEFAVAAIRNVLVDCALYETYHRGLKEELERIERLRRETQAKKLQELEQNRLKLEADRQALEAAEKRRVDEDQRRIAALEELRNKEASRARAKASWRSDQEERLKRQASGLALQKGIRMIQEGTLLICTACNRIHNFNYPVRERFPCEKCKNTVIPLSEIGA